MISQCVANRVTDGPLQVHTKHGVKCRVIPSQVRLMKACRKSFKTFTSEST